MKKDTYPTRKNSIFSIIKRKENTAYNKPLFLSQEEFIFYKENGYLHIENFFCKKDILEFKKLSEMYFDKKINSYTNLEPSSDKIRSVLSIHNEEKAKNLLNFKLINTVQSLLGSDIYIHQSRINYKSDKDANGWNWHSDFETWHSCDGMPKMRCLSALIPLDENTIENGCLKVIPKSHKYFVSCPKVMEINPEDEFSEQKEGVPSDEIINDITTKCKSNIINIECKITDLVLFDCNILHSSNKNSTNGKRANLYFVFNSIKNKIGKPFSVEKNRPTQMGEINFNIL